MEGSAVAAIGTDTGGSIRVPAALCGLAGYRASLGRGDWRGGAHLAQSFDTLGWLLADLEEAPLLGGFFVDEEPARIPVFGRFGIIGDEFLHDCEPEVMACYREAIAQMESLGLRSAEVEVRWWDQAMDIFAPIQASEAAALHRGNFAFIQPAIRERLEWGAGISSDELIALRARHAEFRARMDMHFEEFEVILLPATPVARLDASADHTNTRKRILRYTAPFSLAGVPAVTIPCSAGGLQMAAARNQDEGLLRLAALIGAKRRAPLGSK
jgi:aspartyl-tRNA(Asn)/glutamyl-tRNA(Gln) amidotransferase subunit A